MGIPLGLDNKEKEGLQTQPEIARNKTGIRNERSRTFCSASSHAPPPQTPGTFE